MTKVLRLSGRPAWLGLVLLAVVALVDASAQARDSSAIDLAPKLGVAVGTASEQLPSGEQRVQYGGVRFGLAALYDLSEHLTGVVQGDILLDTPNSQLLSEGAEIGIALHLLGGAHLVADEHPQVSVIATSASNLSLVVRSGLFNFAAANPADVSQRLSGSVFVVNGGFEYRRDISTRQALGLEALAALFSVPASSERLRIKAEEVLAFWRLYQ